MTFKKWLLMIFKGWLITFPLILVGGAFLLFVATIAFELYIPYSNSMKLLQKAKEGDRLSQKELGDAYETGNAVRYSYGRISRNEDKAIYWYTKAFEERNDLPGDLPGRGPDRLQRVHRNTVRRKAGFCLARLYERRKSSSDAIKWYAISATMGDLNAAQRLSLIYKKGELGQAANTQKSAYWQRLSKKNALRVQKKGDFSP